MRNALIISKLSGSIAWISDFVPEWKVFVYSSDRAETSPLFPKVSSGAGEANGYLTYLCRHYESLPPVCVFTPAEFHSYAPHFGVELLAGVGLRSFHPFGGVPLIFDHHGLPFLLREPHHAEIGSFAQFYQAILQTPCPPLLCCRATSTFAVTREQIQARPRQFYEALLQLVNQLPEGKDTLESQSLRLMWHVIFGQAPFSTQFSNIPLSAERGKEILQALESSQTLSSGGDFRGTMSVLTQINEFVKTLGRHQMDSGSLSHE
jgi:hypothetical protein